MMLAGGEFRVVLATIHCALAEVPGRLSLDGLLRLFSLTCRALATGFWSGRAAAWEWRPSTPMPAKGGFSAEEETEMIIPAV